MGKTKNVPAKKSVNPEIIELQKSIFDYCDKFRLHDHISTMMRAAYEAKSTNPWKYFIEYICREIIAAEKDCTETFNELYSLIVSLKSTCVTSQVSSSTSTLSLSPVSQELIHKINSIDESMQNNPQSPDEKIIDLFDQKGTETLPKLKELVLKVKRIPPNVLKKLQSNSKVLKIQPKNKNPKVQFNANKAKSTKVDHLILETTQPAKNKPFKLIFKNKNRDKNESIAAEPDQVKNESIAAKPNQAKDESDTLKPQSPPNNEELNKPSFSMPTIPKTFPSNVVEKTPKSLPPRNESLKLRIRSPSVTSEIKVSTEIDCQLPPKIRYEEIEDVEMKTVVYEKIESAMEKLHEEEKEEVKIEKFEKKRKILCFKLGNPSKKFKGSSDQEEKLNEAVDLSENCEIPKNSVEVSDDPCNIIVDTPNVVEQSNEIDVEKNEDEIAEKSPLTLSDLENLLENSSQENLEWSEMHQKVQTEKENLKNALEVLEEKLDPLKTKTDPEKTEESMEIQEKVEENLEVEGETLKIQEKEENGIPLESPIKQMAEFTQAEMQEIEEISTIVLSSSDSEKEEKAKEKQVLGGNIALLMLQSIENNSMKVGEKIEEISCESAKKSSLKLSDDFEPDYEPEDDE